MKMRQQLFIGLCIIWLCVIWVAGGSSTGAAAAENLFKNRRIHLSIPENRLFRIGITGTTAGYNFIALVEDAKQESIPLGELGYWEQVPDPPSFLRNYDLQLNVKNHAKGKFQIEFEYDSERQEIRYRVKDGAILVKIDDREYYPTLIIDSIASVALKSAAADPATRELKRFIFFDFNSLDVDLREYYGNVKRLLNNPAFTPYFYYYESTDYNSYYFKIYTAAPKLDIEKMGLSTENGTLEYYQKILDNIKSRLGVDFADQIIIVTRFGKKRTAELKKYANEIGLSKTMKISFWSYKEIE
jgi:hypothetical protein